MPMFERIKTLDKELEMPNWNLLCLWRITADHKNNNLFVYFFAFLCFQYIQTKGFSGKLAIYSALFQMLNVIFKCYMLSTNAFVYLVIIIMIYLPNKCLFFFSVFPWIDDFRIALLLCKDLNFKRSVRLHKFGYNAKWGNT